MTVIRQNRHLRSTRLVSAIAVGIALALLVFALPVDRLAVWHWRVRMVTADDAEAARIVGRIAVLGEPGLAALGELLGSSRSRVVEAAQRAIQSEIESWPRLSAADRLRRSLRLAMSLAAHVEDFNPAARRMASAFALRVLRENDTLPVEAHRQLVSACEQILRASVVERRQAMLAAQLRKIAPQRSARRAADDQFDQIRLGALPGGGLPVDGSSAPPVEAIAPTPEESPADEPSGELAAGEPDRLSAEAAANAGAHSLLEPLDDPLAIRQPEENGREEAGEPAGADPTDTLRWMHLLHSDDAALRLKAEVELVRQGFEDLQLELARQLTHPDPKVRRELAESLPAMPGIDARVWLVWLSRDEHAEVRLAAMSVMATTGDPNILKRLEQMARTDADSRVQRQGERLLGLHEAERRSSGAPRRTAR